jgi:hypothetical protein
MLDGFARHAAWALCTFSYSAGPSIEPILFEGRRDGKIVPARGPPNFGLTGPFLLTVPVLEQVIRLAPDAVFGLEALLAAAICPQDRLISQAEISEKTCGENRICDEPLITTCMTKTKSVAWHKRLHCLLKRSILT